ncbi:MAG TPA: hypothetical protein VF186_08820 [Gaiellaceae bacterium]|jgi:hypothetical protein
MGLRETIAGVFSFLGTRTQSERRIAEYVIREHRLGRSLSEILTDPYVTNRCTSEQIDRLLERPELLHALGEDVVAETRAERVAL